MVKKRPFKFNKGFHSVCFKCYFKLWDSDLFFKVSLFVLIHCLIQSMSRQLKVNCLCLMRIFKINNIKIDRLKKKNIGDLFSLLKQMLLSQNKVSFKAWPLAMNHHKHPVGRIPKQREKCNSILGNLILCQAGAEARFCLQNLI